MLWLGDRKGNGHIKNWHSGGADPTGVSHKFCFGSDCHCLLKLVQHVCWQFLNHKNNSLTKSAVVECCIVVKSQEDADK